MKRENHKEGMGEIRSREVTVLDEHDEELDYMLTMAATTPRKRFIKPLHAPGEHENRMLNAIMPESYIRPHKHMSRHSTDTIQALRGFFNVLIFDDQGEITDSIQAYKGRIVSIPPGIWHTVVVHTPCVLYETKGHGVGGYNPETDKVFPQWAPEEGTEESERYLEYLKQEIYESEK